MNRLGARSILFAYVRVQTFDHVQRMCTRVSVRTYNASIGVDYKCASGSTYIDRARERASAGQQFQLVVTIARSYARYASLVLIRVRARRMHTHSTTAPTPQEMIKIDIRLECAGAWTTASGQEATKRPSAAVNGRRAACSSPRPR